MSIAKRFMRKRLVLIYINLIVFFTCFIPVSSQTVIGNAESKRLAKTIFKRMVANEKAIKSMTTHLTMSKYDAYLNITDTISGTLVYLPKSNHRKTYLRMHWLKTEEQLLVIGDEFELYRPRLNLVLFGKIKKISLSGPLRFLNMTKSTLDENYAVMYLGRTKTISGLRMSSLRVTPTSDKTFRWAEFWIDKSGGVRQIKFIENSGDTTTIFLSNIKRNVTVKANIFKLNYPKSVKRIQA